MKRIIYILSAALVALTACTKEIDFKEAPAIDTETGYPEGATVEVVFGIPTPPETRGAMNDTPILDDMHVAVFDGSGALREYVKAERFDKAVINGWDGRQYFKVELKLRNSESHLHFIVNGPAKSTVTGGMESVLLKQWVTDYPNAAYWQRIVLPEGVNAYYFSAYKSKTPEGEGIPWTNGDIIYFYYFEEEEGQYEHVSKAVYDANHSSDDRYKFKSYPVTVSNGRASYNDGSNTVNVGDYVNAIGEKILDGTGYFQSASITEAVASVPLVRNFARIKVRAGTGGNFTPTEYYLMNIPDQGTIAPFSDEVGGIASVYSASNYYTPQYDPEDPDTEPEYFEPYWETTDPVIYDLTEVNKNHSSLMSALNGGRYPATMPATAKLIQTSKDIVKNEANQNVLPTDDQGKETWKKYTVADANTSVSDVQSAFLFERGLPTKDQDPTYLLIGGTLHGHEEERWFKVELTNGDGQYIRIFRDITYFLEIGQVNGSEGYESAADAAVGLSVSDVSNSLATKNLEEVSDGKTPSTTMRVSYIDYVGNKPSGEAKEILYKVFTSNGSLAEPMTNGESRYTLEAEGDCFQLENGKPKIEIVEGSSYTGPDGQSNWCKATIYLKSPASDGTITNGILKISGITEEGERLGNGKTLSREVKYHVMGIQNLTLEATPLENEQAGKRTKLTITLPRGLGYSMFPLVLRIEAEKGNLNPVNAVENNVPVNNINGVKVDLPVDPGTSYFNGKNSFAFLFTINYSDYYDESNEDPYNRTFELWFETTRGYNSQGSTGSNETYFSVTDNNEEHYFFYKPDNSSEMYDPTKNKAVTPVAVTSPNWFFTLSTNSVTVDANVKTASFTVKTNATNSWSLSTNDSGFTTTPALSTSVTGTKVVTVNFDEENTGTSNKVVHLTVTPNHGTAQTVTITQSKPLVHHTGTYSLALNTQQNYNTNSFTQNTTGTKIDFTNCEGYRSWMSGGYQYNGKYIGNRTGGGWGSSYAYNNGIITVTAPTGGQRINGKITKITLTYFDNNNTQTVTYDPADASSTKTTWNGSAEEVAITMACSNSTQYNSRNVVSNISVEYEYDD